MPIIELHIKTEATMCNSPKFCRTSAADIDKNTQLYYYIDIIVLGEVCMSLKNTVVGVVKEVTGHWNKPARGNFVSYKEVVSLGVGGMGQQCVMTLLGVLSLTAGNTLLGATLGIRPTHLQTMAVIQTILNFAFFLIRGWIVDNTRTRWGRFRPYIAVMGFPLVILTTIFVWLPFESMTYNNKLIATFCFAIACSMVSPLFTDTYSEMQTVITPNSQERTRVIAINALIYSAAPTITGFLIPFLSQFMGGLTDIRTYRYIYVAIAVVGVSLNLVTAFGCKERVVSSKTYTQKVNVFRGCAEIYRNKYWWLRTASGWIGFLEGASGVIFSWIYIYGTQNMTTYSLLTTILGSSAGIGMAIAPWVLTKLGNRKMLVYHNALNILFVGLMTFAFKTPIILFVLIYANSLINSFANVYNQSMHSEVKDYQQYLSGRRMDFMFGAAGLIGTPVTMLTGYVIPYVYEYFGLTTNYDILYDPFVRNSLFYVLCILSVIGAVLNLVPFFFYDLSREKHGNIVNVLRYRALFEDFEIEYYDAHKIRDAVDGIRKTFDFVNAPAPDFAALKADLSAAKEISDKKARKEAVKAARKAIKDAKQLLVEKDAAKIFIDEYEKYNRPENAHMVRMAEELAAVDKHALVNLNPAAFMEKAKANPNKKERKAEIRRAKKIAAMVALLKANYPNGVNEPDPARLQTALDMPQETKEEGKAKKLAIKEAEAELQMYHKTMACWLEANETVRRKNSYEDLYERALEKYEWACEEADRLDTEAEKKAAAAK